MAASGSEGVRSTLRREDPPPHPLEPQPIAAVLTSSRHFQIPTELESVAISSYAQDVDDFEAERRANLLIQQYTTPPSTRDNSARPSRN